MEIFSKADEEKGKIISHYSIDIYKLRFLLEISKSIEHDESKDGEGFFIKSEFHEDKITTLCPEKAIPLIRKQSLNHLIIVAGISLFEKACRDWFRWGLIYSPVRIKIYSNKWIKDTFIPLVKKLDCEKVIVTPGNHDFIVESHYENDWLNFKKEMYSLSDEKLIFLIDEQYTYKDIVPEY